MSTHHAFPVTTILAIRHGETAWNSDGRYQGQTDVALNAVGREQATSMAPACSRDLFPAP